MAVFESSAQFVLVNEGNLEKDADSAGVTNHGISLNFLCDVSEKSLRRADVTLPISADSIRHLSTAQAIALYRSEFWEAAPFEKIQNQILCNYIFDSVINLGMAQGIKLAQRAICAAQKKRDFVKDDGVMGPFTLQGINQASFMLCPALIAQRDGFYRRLVDLNPALERYLDGWLNRAYRI